MIQDVISILLIKPLLSGLIGYVIFGISVIVFVQNRRKNLASSVLFLLMGITFLGMGCINTLAVFGLNPWISNQIFQLHTLLWSVIFTLVLSKISHLKRMDFLIIVMLFSLVSVLFSFGGSVFYIIMPLSFYLAGMSFFVMFDSKNPRTRNAGLMGLAGCLIGIIASAFGADAGNLIWVLVNFAFMVSFSSFINTDLGSAKLEVPSRIEMIEEGKPRYSSFAYIICYVLLINLVVFVASLGLHEMGHIVVGNVLGCEGGKIVLLDLLKPSMPGPYTEMICPLKTSPQLLGVSGFSILVPFGLAFLILRKFPERNLAIVICGLAVVIGGLDLMMVVNSQAVQGLSLILGIVIICIGELRLIDEYIGITKRKQVGSVITKIMESSNQQVKTSRT
jgi:hypothetical protein